MPYISAGGTVQDGQTPLSINWFRDLITGFLSFVYLFFASLIGLQSSTQRSNRYQSDYRDRFGGGRNNLGAPRQRNIGRLGGGGGGPSCPPMAGGGG